MVMTPGRTEDPEAVKKLEAVKNQEQTKTKDPLPSDGPRPSSTTKFEKNHPMVCPSRGDWIQSQPGLDTMHVTREFWELGLSPPRHSSFTTNAR